MTSQHASLQSIYPWTKSPLLISAPMYPAAGSRLVSAVTKAGGLGFLAAGTDLPSVKAELDLVCDALHHTPGSDDRLLPIGIGVLNFGADLEAATAIVQQYMPAAMWFFAPHRTADLEAWSAAIRSASDGKTAIWVQVGSVAQAVETVRYATPDVLVIQGSDAGGHGLERGAGIVSLLPEIDTALQSSVPLVAAGGISDGRGVAAALALGAHAAVLGTRFLASPEAAISDAYRDAIVRATDGSQSTVRSRIFDQLRVPNPWPHEVDGRGIVNRTVEDYRHGASAELLREKLETSMANNNNNNNNNDSNEDEEEWESRVTKWAGTGVGLVNSVEAAGEIVKRVREETVRALEAARLKI